MVRDANAHRQIEIKNPAPRIVVGNPAAECGTKDGRQQNAQAISSHGLTVFGKRLEQNGLGKRLQSAPGESLKHAKADQPGKAARQTAQQGGEGEAGDAGQQQSLATEIIGKPTGDGRDDGVGHEIGSDDPSALLHSRGQVSGDVRDGDVDDRGVENLHEGREHHREANDPGIHMRSWVGSHGGWLRRLDVGPQGARRAVTRRGSGATPEVTGDGSCCRDRS